MIRGLETRYVPGGRYTTAFFVVEPLQFSPHLFPSLMALLMAAVSSFQHFSIITFYGKQKK